MKQQIKYICLQAFLNYNFSCTRFRVRFYKVRVRKIEDQTLYYGCKDLGLLCWKLKTL